MYNSIKENKSMLKKLFKESADLTIREMTLISENSVSAVLVTIEGMCNKEVTASSILTPLTTYDFGKKQGSDVIDEIVLSVLASAEIIEINTLDELISFATSGFAVIVVDGTTKMLAVGAQGYSYRSVSEPESEVVQRGSREGFTEPLRVNMSMIRRRIKSPDLVFETITLGKTSRTHMMICYLQKSVSPRLLKKVRRRLEDCDLETVFASGYLTEYLEDKDSRSMFSGVGISERPDTVCGKLTEGRIAILIDGTPAVIIVPHLFVEEFQGVDDYSNRPY